MQVETYEQGEVEVHPEACEEAKRLIEEMGLLGQAEKVSETGQRTPYRQWTAEEHEVYGLILPHHQKVESYSHDTIPLRVLQVLAHAKALGIYEGFEVWHTGTKMDPVLVAYMPGRQWYQGEHHILARWGAELDDFPALVRKAAAKKFEQAREALAKAESQCAMFRERLKGEPTLAIKIPYIGDF